jgi:hypothetical protein
MKLLIDGDLLAYACASVGDGHKWVTSDGHKERYKKDIIKYCGKNNLDVDTLEELYEPEPIENVLHSLKLMLENGIFEHFDSITGYQIFLTGKNNYRNEIGTIQKYKGNRDGTHRPHWLPKCREYLVEQWGAKIVDGEEADDALGYNQDKYSGLEGKTVICSTDKDLRCIPGWHFSWSTDKQEYVSEVDALRNFYSQLITGDSTDNILGLFGCGPKAKAILNIRACENEEDMLEIVAEQYINRFGNYAHRFLVETGRLIWIRRERDEIWDIPAPLEIEEDTETPQQQWNETDTKREDGDELEASFEAVENSL